MKISLFSWCCGKKEPVLPYHDMSSSVRRTDRNDYRYSQGSFKLKIVAYTSILAVISLHVLSIIGLLCSNKYDFQYQQSKACSWAIFSIASLAAAYVLGIAGCLIVCRLEREVSKLS